MSTTAHHSQSHSHSHDDDIDMDDLHVERAPTTPGRATRSRRNSPATTTTRSRRGSPRVAASGVGAGDTASEAEPDGDRDTTGGRPKRGRKRGRVDHTDHGDEDGGVSDSGSIFGGGTGYDTPSRSPPPVMVADADDDNDEAEGDSGDNEETNQKDLQEDFERTQRAWKASVMQLWNQIAENKNANLFRHPVDPKKVDGYSDVVLRPMDLGTIKKNIDLGIIASARDMEHELLLMYTNALMFNTTGEFVHDATLEMRADTQSQLEDFRRIIASTSGGAADDSAREHRRKKADDGTPRSKRSRQTRNA